MTLAAPIPEWLDVAALAAVDTDDLAWKDHIACAEVDPSVFMPPVAHTSQGHRYVNYIQAKAVCDRCPSRLACLATWLERERPSVDDNINLYVGGCSPRERKTVRKALRVARREMAR